MPFLASLILKRVGLLLLAAVAAIIIWILFLRVFDISSLVGKTPFDVAEFLFTDADAAENRAVIGGYLLETIRDFAAGYIVGLAFAFVLAIVFSLSTIAENISMPTAMMFRAIPIIVMTPLITLVFGVGTGSVTVIVTLVVFLPALANILLGLRTAQAQHGDLVNAYGGSSWQLLWKIAVPGSLPAVFASARISVPSAVTGAMIGEWLATGEGLGGFISRSSGSFGYTDMWASAAVITAFTMIVYTVINIADAVVQTRFGEAR